MALEGCSYQNLYCAVKLQILCDRIRMLLYIRLYVFFKYIKVKFLPLNFYLVVYSDGLQFWL